MTNSQSAIYILVFLVSVLSRPAAVLAQEPAPTLPPRPTIEPTLPPRPTIGPTLPPNPTVTPTCVPRPTLAPTPTEPPPPPAPPEPASPTEAPPTLQPTTVILPITGNLRSPDAVILLVTGLGILTIAVSLALRRHA